jgi:hypothetical protein
VGSLPDTQEGRYEGHGSSAAEGQEQAEYVEDLQQATLRRFGYAPDLDDCLAWFEADATVDQAVEWMNHGAGPGDYAGCSDKEGAWDDADE